MNVSEAIKSVNQKRSSNINRMLEQKQYYMSMYRYYMTLLYDKGYISDPTVFNKEEILSNILDLEIKGMFDVQGVVQLSCEWVEYVSYVNKKNNEAKEFLYLLGKILKYKEYSHDIDLFYEEYKKKVSLNLFLKGGRVCNKQGTPITRGSLQCLVNSEQCVKEISIKNAIWEISMKELGIPEKDWYSDGLFDKNLTHEEEVRCEGILLNGKVSSSGKYSDVLNDWLFKHKWSQSKISYNNTGLIEYLYYAKSEKVIEALNERLIVYNAEDVVALYEDTIYIKKDITNYKIPCSQFVVLVDGNDNLIQESTVLTGYTGEAYSADYLEEEGISYIGLPIKVLREDLESVYVYDREQVDTKSETWFKSMNMCLDFEYTDYINPFKQGTVHYLLFESYLNSLKGEMGSINLKETDLSIKEIRNAEKRVVKAILKAVNS